jgi:hypothetical protein
MMDPVFVDCQEPKRKKLSRERNFNGIDFVEVGDDQLGLCVHFFGKMPEDIEARNIQISGGHRIRNIQVVKVQLRYASNDQPDDCLHITVDKAGDFSLYSVRLFDTDSNERPTQRPFHGFDPRYAHIEFSFKVNCPSDFDCKPMPVCPQESKDEPEIDYLARDYASLRQLILDRLSLIMPDWLERHVPDLGVALVELLAYMGDYLSYYQDAVATEAYLDTARKRTSIRRHARLVDYRIHEGCNARALLCVETDAVDISLDPREVYFITVPKDTPGLSDKILTSPDLPNLPDSSHETFEPMSDAAIRLSKAHNAIPFYTWQDKRCCLPIGATAATLADEWEIPSQSSQEKPQGQISSQRATDATRKRKLHLQAGDILLLTEVKGPQTGEDSDADPAHRHPVRLIKVEPGLDPVTDQPTVEVEWATEDALPFDLCLSAGRPAPYCDVIEGVSVACGNVILVDHGRTIEPPEKLGQVCEKNSTGECECEGVPVEMIYFPEKFHPQAQKQPLTFNSRPSPDGTAVSLLTQDPRKAIPCITLGAFPAVRLDDIFAPLFDLKDVADPSDLAVRLRNASDTVARALRSRLSNEIQNLLEQYDGSGTLPEGLGTALTRELSAMVQAWLPQWDLLGSNSEDRHFVVEIDDEGRANLRFGNGESGKMPDAGTTMIASYRVGNGPSGNVGSETISAIVFRKTRMDGVSLQVRNPLPAQGGMGPESVEEVRLFAPHAFRKRLQRAVTAEDYAVLAGQNRKIQRAAATLAWTGSWYSAQVGIDPFGTEEPKRAMLKEIAQYLHIYRRMGHDVEVVKAAYVPLDIEMKVCVLPHYLRAHVEPALLQAFGTAALPDGAYGFFHPDSLSFGDGVHLSRLIATAQAIAGVKSVTITKLERLFEGPNHEIENGVLPLGSLEIVQMDNDPNFPEHGRIILITEGGR